MQTHIIAMTVIDEPGVLTKISGLFTRRGFNIDTITVGKTETANVSRITISLRCNEKTLEQLEKQLNKMIDIIKVINVTNNSIIRETMPCHSQHKRRGLKIRTCSLHENTSCKNSRHEPQKSHHRIHGRTS